MSHSELCCPGTVFAYGQTSSGKTYTMRGSQAEPGVTWLAVDDVFRSIQEVSNAHGFTPFLQRHSSVA